MFDFFNRASKARRDRRLSEPLPAEFFAVVTELFFERGAELARTHPELYEQFASFYRQDPAKRPPPRGRKERRARH